ncbi:MAG: hypothetical protein AAF416_16415 [Pseudomonadota bacterium]
MTWLERTHGGTPPLLDANYLARLTRHLGEDVMAELLADGELELTDRARQLRRGVAHRDARSLRAASHDLIAVAGHLGLSALSLACVDLNRQIARAEPDEIDGLCAPVISLAEQSIEALGSARISGDVPGGE